VPQRMEERGDSHSEDDGADHGEKLNDHVAGHAVTALVRDHSVRGVRGCCWSCRHNSVYTPR
jgi:hypothetical protein